MSKVVKILADELVHCSLISTPDNFTRPRFVPLILSLLGIYLQLSYLSRLGYLGATRPLPRNGLQSACPGRA